MNVPIECDDKMELTNGELITTERMRSFVPESSIVTEICLHQLLLAVLKCFFGMTLNVCVFLWLHLGGLLTVGAIPKHLLWSLSCLKLYEVEEDRASRL